MKHFKRSRIVLLSLIDLTLCFPIQLKIIKVRVKFIYNFTCINLTLRLIINSLFIIKHLYNFYEAPDQTLHFQCIFSIYFLKDFCKYETYMDCRIFTIFVKYVNKRSFCYYNTDRVTFDLNHVAFWTNKSQGEFLSYNVVVPTYFTSHSHFIYLNKYV